MATTLYNESYNEGAYGSQGYVSDAYTFTPEIILNSQSGLISDITIKYSIIGNHGFWYNGFSGINVTMDTKDTVNTEYQRRVTTTYNSMSGTAITETIFTYTGQFTHASDGSLTLTVKIFYDGGESSNVLPRLHTKEITVTVPAVSVSGKAYVKVNGTWHKGELYFKSNGSWHKSSANYLKNSSWRKDNG